MTSEKIKYEDMPKCCQKRYKELKLKMFDLKLFCCNKCKVVNFTNDYETWHRWN